jgi:hypothetical protein
MTYSAFSGLAQRRICGVSRKLIFTMIVLTVFTLLPAVQYGVQKDMLCLRILFNP